MELLRRGHDVTGIERTPEKLGKRPGLTLARGDATRPTMLAAAEINAY